MGSNAVPTVSPLRGVRECPIADALDLIGDRWSILVIREIIYGETKFNVLQEHTGAPRQILSARLKKLEVSGVIKRAMYSEHPPRYEYTLTTAGEALRPVLRALRAWGEGFAPHVTRS
jgi:DNA-binding HxlR family transcriptional regulator